MKTISMFLKTTGRRVVIFGGGERAAQKARMMLKAKAEAEDVRPADLARAARAVDAPGLCDAFTRSTDDREPLGAATGAEGDAPVLARQIRAGIESMLEPRLRNLIALASRVRPAVATRPRTERRRAFWAQASTGAPRRAQARGAEREAACILQDAVAAGAKGAPSGFVSLVGAGPGARDLITLRGVQRMQEADVIFYDRLVDPDLLDLARRDAERVHVGKAPGATAWPQDRINGVIIAAARAGKRVVRLKCGDPGIFARGAEEGAACAAADVPWEIVPGVTAASAAVAEIGGFLTERGAYNSLVLTTGATRPGDPAPDWAGLVRPGTTIALYMGVASAPGIRLALLAGGAPPASLVQIVAEAGTSRARSWTTNLAALADTVAREAISNPAIILVRLPKASEALSLRIA